MHNDKEALADTPQILAYTIYTSTPRAAGSRLVIGLGAEAPGSGGGVVVEKRCFEFSKRGPLVRIARHAPQRKRLKPLWHAC